jgi:hypothetical protein
LSITGAQQLIVEEEKVIGYKTTKEDRPHHIGDIYVADPGGGAELGKTA